MRHYILSVTSIFVLASLAGGQVSPEEAMRRLKQRQQGAASQPSKPSHSDAATTSAPSAQPVGWAKLPPARWPQIVLTNEASFEGHTPLEGASSFLVKMPNGEVLLGTAKHLIKEPGGVQPPVALPDLGSALKEWTVYPRTKPTLTLQVGGLAENMNREDKHDWLLLHLRDQHAKLPATPLVPRAGRAKVGETVYLVGVPYSDKKSSQNVYKGVVTGRPHRNYFTYEFTPPVHISGFSGAPIVDAEGLLLGHGVSRSELKQQDGMEIEFGGEDVSVALQLWEHRDEPRQTDISDPKPADLLKFQMPAGWVPRNPPNPVIVKFAQYGASAIFFHLIGESEDLLDQDATVMDYAKLVKRNAAGDGTLARRKETDLKAGKIGDRPTAEYEISGEIKGIEVRYRIIMLHANGCFWKLTCWSSVDQWDAAQPKFEEVARSIK